MYIASSAIPYIASTIPFVWHVALLPQGIRPISTPERASARSSSEMCLQPRDDEKDSMCTSNQVACMNDLIEDLEKSVLHD
ncbi:unnamed protein product [Calypogeia fissa]